MSDTIGKGNRMVKVSMLGNFALEMDGAVLDDSANRSQKIWSVLSYLVIHRERDVSQAELIELFWDDEDSANPVNALKTLLYRIRAMLTQLFGDEFQPILSRRGSYAWNSDLPCEVDVDLFEQLCAQAAKLPKGSEEAMAAYRRATDLYRGDFLPKLSSQLWVVPLQTRFHVLYLEMAKQYIDLLEEQSRFDEMAAVCAKTSQMDLLDEEIHARMIRALMGQGKVNAARNHYENATEFLYRNLGVRPSQELRSLYQRIMDVEKSPETDLSVIQDDLREAEARKGAFFCEYGFFQEAYRLEARRSIRSGNSVHIVLVTVSMPNGATPKLEVLSNTMEKLVEVIVEGLRKGDVVARYSGAQYVVMLPNANLEDGRMVMDRIVHTFQQKYRRNYLRIEYKIQAMEPVR